jgi:hypothetical protein
MNMEIDFLCETILHVSEVSENIEVIASELRKRGISHDRTKFQAIEFEAFVSTREQFKNATYGTPEYQSCVDAIQPAVEHHYQNNRHHPGFHPNGVSNMTLIDLVEMVADWKAAERRSPDKKLIDTLDSSFNKYGIGEQLGCMIKNTLASLGWIEDAPSMTQEARQDNKESKK